ncbi:hypothetical protein HD597_006021 [Nonomuraea thailandensis]|uniref:YtkA-like domain-containing protein n=1 Tax=Nonomuraea thailandensis TaxID=1188745 RepID=A0A9X2GHK2_9ACTN|nr:FixH family protein [Nonomuraea thailandensis]MCP2359001.1 hypothetical protein [Nonomuraea thailandensis]
MMRRLLAGACLAAAAMTVAVGCLSGPGPVTAQGAGARYAVTLTIERGETADIIVERGEADAVVVMATMPQMGHVTPEEAARRLAPGRFRADGDLFTMDGVWEVSVRVSGAAGEEVIPLTVLVTS